MKGNQFDIKNETNKMFDNNIEDDFIRMNR